MFFFFGFYSIEKSFLPLRFREPQTASLTVSIHHVHTRHTHFLPFPLNSVSTFCVWAFPLPSALFFTCSHISEHLMYSRIHSCFSRGHRLNVQEHASISRLKLRPLDFSLAASLWQNRERMADNPLKNGRNSTVDFNHSQFHRWRRWRKHHYLQGEDAGLFTTLGAFQRRHHRAKNTKTRLRPFAGTSRKPAPLHNDDIGLITNVKKPCVSISQWLMFQPAHQVCNKGLSESSESKVSSRALQRSLEPCACLIWLKIGSQSGTSLPRTGRRTGGGL